MALESVGLRMTGRGYEDGPLFHVRFKLSCGWVTITAWDAGFQAPNHTRLDLGLKVQGRTLFERGAMYCGAPGCADDDRAKELATSCFCLKPGDTDADFFASYTPEQLAWVTAHAEELDMARADRFCDPETGEVRR